MISFVFVCIGVVFVNLPDTGEESAEEKGAVSLDKGGEEGEDAVDGQTDEERLPTAYPVSKSPPEERPHHHPEIYNQTCGDGKNVHIEPFCHDRGPMENAESPVADTYLACFC